MSRDQKAGFKLICLNKTRFHTSAPVEGRDADTRGPVQELKHVRDHVKSQILLNAHERGIIKCSITTWGRMKMAAMAMTAKVIMVGVSGVQISTFYCRNLSPYRPKPHINAF